VCVTGDVGKPTKEQKNYLHEIANANKRMVDLVNSLLNVSRIDLGTFAVEPKLTNVIDLVKVTLSELTPQILSKKIIIKEVYDQGIPIMKVDPKLLKIIFQNLLSNAVKYTPDQGKISIQIDLHYRKIFNGKGVEKEGVIITVADSGYGIPKHQQDKIFTKLFRADNVREKDVEGTGLGLYVVKAIVEQSGGKIWFESEENKGSTFHVSLPLTGMIKKEGTKQLS
jgi:signal transduction histidine kinase